MARSPYVSAILIPSQGTTGWGAFHRSSPTGGAAKGMPLYTSTSLFSPGTPWICPPVIERTGFLWPHAPRARTARRSKKRLMIIFSLDLVYLTGTSLTAIGCIYWAPSCRTPLRVQVNWPCGSLTFPALMVAVPFFSRKGV